MHQKILINKRGVRSQGSLTRNLNINLMADAEENGGSTEYTIFKKINKKFSVKEIWKSWNQKYNMVIEQEK